MGLPDRESAIEGVESLPTLLRPNDVARLLSVSRAWVYEAARTGRIPSFRLGSDDGPLRFLAADIEHWLAEARSSWRPGRVSRPAPAQADEPESVVPIHGQQSLL